MEIRSGNMTKDRIEDISRHLRALGLLLSEGKFKVTAFDILEHIDEKLLYEEETKQIIKYIKGKQNVTK